MVWSIVQVWGVVCGQAGSSRWRVPYDTTDVVIAGTAHLPPELQRILNTIKDLDERSEGAHMGCASGTASPRKRCYLTWPLFKTEVGACRSLTSHHATPPDVGAQIQDNVELGLKGKLGKEEVRVRKW